MYLKKVLNQPNLVGTVMIALLVCSGFVYAFAFDGFNVETATGGEVEAWLAAAGGGGSGGECKCDLLDCSCGDNPTCNGNSRGCTDKTSQGCLDGGTNKCAGECQQTCKSAYTGDCSVLIPCY